MEHLFNSSGVVASLDDFEGDAFVYFDVEIGIAGLNFELFEGDILVEFLGELAGNFHVFAERN